MMLSTTAANALPDTVETLAQKLAPSHLRIADDYLGGATQTDAYHREHPDVQRATAEREGYRVIRRHPLVTAYVEAVTARRSFSTVIAKEERRELLAQAIRGKRPNKTTRTFDGDGNSLRVKEESISLDRALELDAKLAGDLDGGAQVAVLIDFDKVAAELDHAGNVFAGWAEPVLATLTDEGENSASAAPLKPPPTTLPQRPAL